jgi:hypothetical protein
MVAVGSPLDPGKKQALRDFAFILRLIMQAGNMTRHFLISSDCA